MPVIELKFPVRGKEIVADHGYYLYSAISRLVSGVHGWDDILINGISGVPDNRRVLHLNPASKLRIRLPAEKIGDVLKLAGKSLSIAENKVTLGIPQTSIIKPRANLYSRLVLIKVKEKLTAESFLQSVQKQLKILDIEKEPVLFKNEDGGFVRKTMHIKGKELVGYPLIFTELSPQDSVLLQEKGLGGKKKMGCGTFVGVRG